MNDKNWHVAELIQSATGVLEKNHIENPRLNAELLLGKTLGFERIELYLHYDRPVDREELSTFRMLIRRRLTREPLQYILGITEFMSLTFEVSPDALIPRPETEILVEWVIESEKENAAKWILDIGTGAGNIAVSLAYYLPNSAVVAVDISKEALQVAQKNIARHDLSSRVFLLRIDIRNSAKIFKHRFDLLVSNPPYIQEAEFKKLQPEVVQYEPEIALRDPQNNGFFYDKIAQVAADLLKENGKIFVEVGSGQVQVVEGIFRRRGFNYLETRKDLAGIERVICAQK